MRTPAMRPLPPLTVHAQNLQVIRVLIGDDPCVEIATISVYLAAIHTVVVDVVD
jgi:hypothetical protein